MSRRQEDLQVNEKNRIRAEINVQVEEFLRRGGCIDKLNRETEAKRSGMKNVWPTSDDDFKLVSGDTGR